MSKISFLVVFMLLFSMISFSVSASTSYNETGVNLESNYRSGSGIFNDAITTDSISGQRSLADGINIPVVGDLDGDGINEIVIIDKDDLEIYSGSSLTIVDAIGLEGDQSYSNPILSDIDNDGKTEIIFATENRPPAVGNVSIYEYNGSTLFKQASLGVVLPSNAVGTNEIILKCNDGQAGTESVSCLYIVSNSRDGAGTRRYDMTSFNATNINAITTILSTSTTTHDYCFPAVQSISYDNLDNSDSRKEFAFSYVDFDSAGSETLYIRVVDIAEDLTITTDLTMSHTTDFNPVTSSSNCATDNLGQYYTSPLMAEVDGSTSNGKELIFGINEDAEDFVIRVYGSNGVSMDVHPSLFQADGEIVSNVMIADVFGDTDEVEYCVLGHDDDDQELNLLCGSQQTGNIADTIEFKYNTDASFNITKTYEFQNIISHMGQHSSNTEDIAGEGLLNPTDLISSYGVFQLKEDTYNGSTFIKDMDIIYENPIGDSACIPVDAEKTGSDDLICVQQTLISYIDDGLSNQPAEITAVNINPCVDNVIKINSTMQVKVTVTDQNSEVLGQDLVSSRVTIYDGLENEHSTLIENVTSGSVSAHAFDMNQTGTGIEMLIEGWDTVNPSTVDTIEQTFTVADSGVSFGDCETDLLIEPDEEEEFTNESLTASDENLLKKGASEANAFLKIGLIGVWLLFMLLVNIVVLVEAKDFFKGWESRYLFALMAGINVLMLIIGAISTIISFWVILLLLILGIAIAILYVVNKFEGSRVM